MNAPAAARAVRGFDWRLAALQRKLEWELEAAEAALGRELAAREQARADHVSAEQRVDAAAAEARAALLLRADPRAHRGMLGYLVAVGDQVAVAAARLQTADDSLAQARQDVLRRQRRLEGLLRARKDALDAHLRAAARREQSDADAGWLAVRALRRREELA
jgi:hypothetical protein